MEHATPGLGQRRREQQLTRSFLTLNCMIRTFLVLTAESGMD